MTSASMQFDEDDARAHEDAHRSAEQTPNYVGVGALVRNRKACLASSDREGGRDQGKRGSFFGRLESGNPLGDKSPEGSRTSNATGRRVSKGSSFSEEATRQRPSTSTDVPLPKGRRKSSATDALPPAPETPAKPPPEVDGAALLSKCKGEHTSAYVQGGLRMYEFAAVMMEDATKQEHLADLIGDMLQETVARNDMRGRKGTLASFEGKKKAPISPKDYVKRIMKYAGCSPCCLAVGVLYLERLKRRHNGLCLTSFNFQRLFLVAVMEAAKYLDDLYFSNKHWAEVGGFSLEEMNGLELEFLFRINFYLSVQREDYDAMVGQLVGDDDDAPPSRNRQASPARSSKDTPPSSPARKA
mmetsp:Transcript_38259/g.95793  ORF Transcript_38259/g.95793 Transcript_38259/m.95793 type:complete len:357 (+) Transcript_38259:50-1120(+)